MKKFEIFWIFALFTIPAGLGIFYSYFNIDPHHWGFILGSALDYIHGKSLFTEVYVQYGVGQIVLFKFLNFFLPINYTSIGIITSVIYALNLVVLYLGVRKMSGPRIAMVISAAALALHTYAIYPWPDYYAGLCLSLVAYSFVSCSQATSRILSKRALIPGSLLFLATFFRNTYIINIGAAGITYFILSVVFKRIRNSDVLRSLSVFLFLGCSYFFFLYLQGNLQLWYGQGIGAGTGEYGITLNSVWALLKQVFLPAKPWVPNNIITTSFSILYYAAAYVILSNFLNQTKSSDEDENRGVYVFLALLGLAGVVQGMAWYQIFRIQNSCAPLYFVMIYFVMTLLPNLSAGTLRKVQVGMGIYLILLFIKFPNATAIYPLYSDGIQSYSESTIPIFKGHRFHEDSIRYYEALSKIICSDPGELLNMTMDSSLPHLCERKESALVLPFYFKPLLSKFYHSDFDAYEKGEFKVGQIVIADQPVVLSSSVKMETVAEFPGPKFVMFGYRGPVKVFKVLERAD